MTLCAACGIGEDDDIKLKKCTACDLARYCSDKCQLEHLPEHEQICKKRAAELRDEILFKQPEISSLGDCPICLLPVSFEQHRSVVECCSNMICFGCEYANFAREAKELLEHKCPFCRHPVRKSHEKADLNSMKRNDPVAMREMGMHYYNKGDYKSAFEYLSKAAGLGDADAHCSLSDMYQEGQGVQKDEKKQVYHLEEAAIGGHTIARHNLGCKEWENGRPERAMKHFIIAANMGYDKSLDNLREAYRKGKGYVSKQDFAATLCAHQAAVDATKSPQRDEAEAFLLKLKV